MGPSATKAIINIAFMCAALAITAGAAPWASHPAYAGSCCGGGSSSGLLVPAQARSVLDLSLDRESYDGYWNRQARYKSDPPGSDLMQYRLNIGYGRRLSDRWQASVVVPHVWNDNTYSGISSKSNGLGDISAALMYEATRDMSAWRIRSPGDLVPSVTVGPALVIPTGISPYDDADSSFDVTGRGFYRLDANVLVSKTIQPVSVSLSMGYGKHLSRPVNREYGRYVQPYRKELGDRQTAGISIAYNYFLGSGGDTLTASATYSTLYEGQASIDSVEDPSSGFRKRSTGYALSYSSTDSDWSVRASVGLTRKADDAGRNFPATDTASVGVRYVFR